MTLVVDAAPLIALMNAADPSRESVRKTLRDEQGQLIIPAPISAEVDYLVGRRLGRVARRAFYSELVGGRFLVACLEPSDYEVLLTYDEGYADLDVGLADISVVILARRFRTRRILTFDERHFRALRPLDGGSFVLLPRDAP